MMQDGQVREIGDHESLVGRAGLYAQLVSRQFASAYAPAAQ